MAKQAINTGTLPNDGTGDSLRSAAIKINQNFTELYDADVTNNDRVSDVFDVANGAVTLAQQSYDYANTLVSDTFIDPFARTTANAGFTQANVTNAFAGSAYGQANATNSYAVSSYAHANSANNLAQAAYNYANTIVSDTQIDPYARVTANAGFIAANTGIILAQAAFDASNDYVGVANTGNVTFTDTTIGTTSNSSNVFIQTSWEDPTASPAISMVNTWQFGRDGELTVPAALNLQYNDVVVGSIGTGPGGFSLVPEQEKEVSVITTNEIGEPSLWVFKNDGALNLPEFAELNSPLGEITMSTADPEESVLTRSYAGFYSESANTAVVTHGVTDNSSKQVNTYLVSNPDTNTRHFEISIYDGGEVYGTSSWKFDQSGKLQTPSIFAPSSSLGATGDTQGMLGFTTTHMYFCTGNYDGVTNVWRRIAWDAGDTW